MRTEEILLNTVHKPGVHPEGLGLVIRSNSKKPWGQYTKYKHEQEIREKGNAMELRLLRQVELKTNGAEISSHVL